MLESAKPFWDLCPHEVEDGPCIYEPYSPSHQTTSDMADEQKQQKNEDRGGSQPKYSPNDDRSIAKNPTSPAHEADQKNQRKQREG